MKLINNINNATKKIPFFFTIDLEDISHDILYNITGDKLISVREKSIIKSYEKIKFLISDFFPNKKITFFTTAILAKKFPDILKQISKDGHEIACQHYFHDKIFLKNRSDFSSELDLSIEAIEKACGQRPLGYRAPMFSINKKEYFWAYHEIFQRFQYDSSFIISNKNNKNIEDAKLILKKNLKSEFYIYEKKYFFNLIKVKAGGSFFRLFTKEIIKNTMEDAYKNNYIPIIYLHPYDLLCNKEFWLKLSDFNNCSFSKKFLYWIRQNQWHSIGNKTVEKKLKYLSKYFDHSGKMCDYKFPKIL